MRGIRSTLVINTVYHSRSLWTVTLHQSPHAAASLIPTPNLDERSDLKTGNQSLTSIPRCASNGRVVARSLTGQPFRDDTP